MTLSFTNRYDLYKCVALKPTRANRLFNCFFVLYSDRFLPNLPLLLDLRKFFVSFPPLHIFVYYAGLFWHLINWRAKALFDKTVLISLRHHFFSLYTKHKIFITSLSTSIAKPYKKCECIFFTWCIVFDLFNCPLATLQTRNVYNCIMFQKLAISPYSHSQPNSVFISQSSVFLWTCKFMSVRNHPKRLHTKS